MTSTAEVATGRRVFALMVGINAYLPPISALYGCVPDVTAVEGVLRDRLGDQLVVRKMLDAEATRDGVIEAFREHLGQAGLDDTALFVYAGHGTEEPASPEYSHLESTDRIQTLLLYDCGRRINGKLVRALADKELALLIDEVAKSAGHVAVILDCCSSGGGTRDVTERARGWTPPSSLDSDLGADIDRDVGSGFVELGRPRAADEFLDGALVLARGTAPNHVALAACKSDQKAKETSDGTGSRGAFSVALAESLATLGDHATYRSLLDTVASRVKRVVDAQHPELYPVDQGGLADQPFLGGPSRGRTASFTVSRSRDGWTADGGVIHGLHPPGRDGDVVLACTAPDGSAAGTVRVIDVGLGMCTVEPIDWTPQDVAYDAVIASVATPPAEVVIDAGVPAAIANEIASSGPLGGASPWVAAVDAPTADAFVLSLSSPSAGVVRIDGPDLPSMPSDVDLHAAGPNGAAEVVRRMEHIARWATIRGLRNPTSMLEGAVALDLFAAEPGEASRPPDRVALAAQGSTNPRLELDYRPDGSGGWAPPSVFIELRNTTDDMLWVALLDLNDRFAAGTIAPAMRLAPNHAVSAIAHGGPVPIKLPAERPIEPGAFVTDWLTVIASEEEFGAQAFHLPVLGMPIATEVRSVPTTRDRDDPQPSVAQWAAQTLEVVSRVPDPSEQSSTD